MLFDFDVLKSEDQEQIKALVLQHQPQISSNEKILEIQEKKETHPPKPFFGFFSFFFSKFFEDL